MHKTPAIMAALLPNVLWKVRTDIKEIYLTFDDGPVPEATPWVLELLEKYGANATFFMVGENVVKYPEIYKTVSESSHTIGSHTYSHLNGWQTANELYFANVNQAEQVIKLNSPKYFRPPYGKLKWLQYRRLKKNHKIVMWDVLSGDFNSDLAADVCLAQSIKATGLGSIVVFHDSIKSFAKLKIVLPQYLDYFAGKGYTFKAL